MFWSVDMFEDNERCKLRATTKPAATEMTGRRNAASLARFRWLILMSLGGAGHHQANSVTVDGLACDDTDDPAAIHDGDACGEIADHWHGMRDEEIGEAEFAL